jgi:hypothetical protein
MTSAMPLSPATSYTGSEATSTWDESKIYGCVCDSTWTVGMASGQTQEPEFFGPGCELRKSRSRSIVTRGASFLLIFLLFLL